MSRKKARDNAFKCIYQMEYVDKTQIEIDKIIQNCFEENENIENEKEYIKKVVNGVYNYLQEIDSIILGKLKNWKVDRIAKIDLAILRLAIYEIKYIKSIPPKVSANEAVELAKTYGNPDSQNFVNGVIAKVIEEGKKYE